MKRLVLFLTGVSFVLLFMGVSSAAPFQNGSFELGLPDADVGQFVQLSAGSLDLPGWTIEAGSIDLIGTLWQAADGKRSVDLSGSGPGVMSQTFDTVAKMWYLVQFNMAGNPDDPNLSNTVKALVASATPSDAPEVEFQFNTAGKTHTDMGWTIKSFVFRAETASTKLTFESLTDSPYGPAIDNVLVVQIPRPFPEDTMPPTGAVHAYANLLWPPNNKPVKVTLEGYILDELSIARDEGGIGVSKAYLEVNGKVIVLKDNTTNLLDEDGRFSVVTELKAVKGAVYSVKLFAADTTPAPDGPNQGLVDATHVSIPHDMSGARGGSAKTKSMGSFSDFFKSLSGAK